MKAEEMFKEYHNYKRQAEMLKFQIENFTCISKSEYIEYLNFENTNEDYVQTSNLPDKTAKIAISYRGKLEKDNEDYYNFIVDKYRVVQEEIKFFEVYVASLSEVLCNIISDMVFNSMTWDEISEKYEISRRTVGRYRKKAIQELDKLYCDREIYFILS